MDLLPLSQVLPEVNAPIAGLRGLGKTLRMAQVETILAFCCFALERLSAEGTGRSSGGCLLAGRAEEGLDGVSGGQTGGVVVVFAPLAGEDDVHPVPFPAIFALSEYALHVGLNPEPVAVSLVFGEGVNFPECETR